MTNVRLTRDGFIAGVKADLLAAGYAAVVAPSPQGNVQCDLVAYAPGPHGVAIGTAVATKFGGSVDFDLEAIKLDWVRESAGLDGGLMVTRDGIYGLSPNGKGFIHVDEIPRVTPSDEPVQDIALANSLLWELFNESRGVIDPSQFPGMLLGSVKIYKGAVQTRAGGPKIEGTTFRQAFSAFLNRFPKNDLPQLASSEALQLVISQLASLFPTARKILDPFFGAGLTTFATVDKLQALSLETDLAFTVKGFEINNNALEFATELSKTAKGIGDLSITLGSASELEWPRIDLLLSQPPMGLFLPEPMSVRGVTVKNVEHFAILRSALGVDDGSIRDGAVLVTSRSWLSRNDCQNLRDKLADLGVVKAILGLPGLSVNTALPLVAVVMKKGAGRVVMGELFDDWASVIADEEGELRGLLGS